MEDDLECGHRDGIGGGGTQDPAARLYPHLRAGSGREPAQCGDRRGERKPMD